MNTSDPKTSQELLNTVNLKYQRALHDIWEFYKVDPNDRCLEAPMREEITRKWLAMKMKETCFIPNQQCSGPSTQSTVQHIPNQQPEGSDPPIQSTVQQPAAPSTQAPIIPQASETRPMASQEFLMRLPPVLQKELPLWWETNKWYPYQDRVSQWLSGKGLEKMYKAISTWCALKTWEFSSERFERLDSGLQNDLLSYWERKKKCQIDQVLKTWLIDKGGCMEQFERGRMEQFDTVKLWFLVMEMREGSNTLQALLAMPLMKGVCLQDCEGTNVVQYPLQQHVAGASLHGHRQQQYEQSRRAPRPNQEQHVQVLASRTSNHQVSPTPPPTSQMSISSNIQHRSSVQIISHQNAADMKGVQPSRFLQNFNYGYNIPLSIRLQSARHDEHSTQNSSARLYFSPYDCSFDDGVSGPCYSISEGEQRALYQEAKLNSEKWDELKA